MQGVVWKVLAVWIFICNVVSVTAKPIDLTLEEEYTEYSDQVQLKLFPLIFI